MPVAIITGGARGIGRAIAKELDAQGYDLGIGDLDETLAKETVADLSGNAVGGRLDVADAASFAAFHDHVVDEFGPVDLLVNNAGIMPIGRFHELDQATMLRAVDVNLVGVMNGVRVVLPSMLAREHGHIVNVSSIAGKCPPPGGAVYAATKAGVLALGESLRQEYAAQGIQVTAVLPSFTNTELVAGIKGLRGIKNLEPEEVAVIVGKAVRKRPPVIYAPQSLRFNVRLYDNLPARANDLLAKLFGGDRAFLEVDRASRRGYDERIGQA